jgi:hypothetical protein
MAYADRRCRKVGENIFLWEKEQNSLVTNTHTNGGVCFGVG